MILNSSKVRRRLMAVSQAENQPMTHPGSAMPYHAVRLAHARQALLAGLRRWGAWIGSAVIVVAMFGGDPVLTAQGIAALTALPLWQAATDLALDPLSAARWLRMLAPVAVIALLAQLPLMAARHWWWPRHWAMAERALPLTAQTRWLSDLRLQHWFTAPVCSVPAMGLAALALRATDATAPGTLAWAVAGLLAAWCAANALAWTGMQAVRWHACRGLHGTPHSAGLRHPSRAGLRPCHWAWALLALPLRRGAGRGSAALLLGGFTATPVLAAGPLLGEQAQGLGLMMLAVLALPLSALLQQRLRMMVSPWRLTLGSLPIRQRTLDRAVLALALGPLALGLVTAAATLAWTQARQPWSLAYLLALGIGSWVELRSRPDTPAADRVMRWLLTVISGAALAWQTIPR